MQGKERIEELVRIAEYVPSARRRFNRRGALSFAFWGGFVLLGSLASLLGMPFLWSILAVITGTLDAGRYKRRWLWVSLTGLGGFALSLGLYLVSAALAGVAFGATIAGMYLVGLWGKKGEGGPLARLVGGLWVALVLGTTAAISAFGLWGDLRQLLLWNSMVGVGMMALGFGFRSWAYTLGGLVLVGATAAFGSLGLGLGFFGLVFGAVCLGVGVYEYSRALGS